MHRFNELYLNGVFRRTWEGRDPFQAVHRLDGVVYRRLENRKTLRFTLDGAAWFVKIHHGTPWEEILKNLVLLRLPIVSARNEWRALRRLEALGIDTVRVAAYGRRGMLPWKTQSFLVTEDLGAHETLEDICARWPEAPPAYGFRKQVVEQVARISRRLHHNGVCHRDFYICHFLYRKNDRSKLFLIDLHRALIKKKLRRRWLVKDVGSLYFSALDAGLSNRDLLRFVRLYSGKPLPRALREDAGFWRAVEHRALALKLKHA